MAVANPRDLAAVQLQLSRPVVNQHKIIPRPIHLGEFNHHEESIAAAPADIKF
jgi:hypothetical protein